MSACCLLLLRSAQGGGARVREMAARSSRHRCSTEGKVIGGCTSLEGVSVSRFARSWVGKLAGSGVPEPDCSVRWILEHVLRKDYKKVNKLMAQRELQLAENLLTRRLAREPVQYIIGEWDFRNVTLTMQRPVFIPTPETEELVGLVLEHCRTEQARRREGRGGEGGGGGRGGEGGGGGLRFLDLCCGSGAIAVSLLQENRQLEGVAVDCSRDAVQLTKLNAARNGVGDRLTTIHCRISDCPSRLGSDEKFDFITCNPPYLTQPEMATLQTELDRYVDPQALAGGKGEGLGTVKEILAASRHLLKPASSLWLELGLGQSDGIGRLLQFHSEWELAYESHYNDFTSRIRFHRLTRRPQQL